jgi:hypothetical protein
VPSPSPAHARKFRRTFTERRRWARRKPGPGVACQLLLGGTTAGAGLLNLCEGGACVEPRLPLAVGDRLTLRLFNRPCLCCLTAEACVVWCVPCSGAFRVGLRFERALSAADLHPFFS